MTTRTFKQMGQAYGSTPCAITATINGVIVFSGEIPTLDIPFPILPNTAISTVDLFTWNNTVDFSGTQSFSISVANAPLLLTNTQADCVLANNTTAFSSFYSYDNNGVTVVDPFTNVAIDGVVMQKSPDYSTMTGQWYWSIPAGSTFSATLNVSAGVEPT